MKHRFVLAFSTGLAVCVSLTSLVAAEKKSPEARLQQLFKTYPDADANKDGKLSEEVSGTSFFISSVGAIVPSSAGPESMALFRKAKRQSALFSKDRFLWTRLDSFT